MKEPWFHESFHLYLLELMGLIWREVVVAAQPGSCRSTGFVNFHNSKQIKKIHHQLHRYETKRKNLPGEVHYLAKLSRTCHR